MHNPLIDKNYMEKKRLIFNFNLKSSKKNIRINYSLNLQKYLKNVNLLKFANFYKKTVKNRRKFKRRLLNRFRFILNERKISLKIIKQYKKINPFKKIRNRRKRKKKKLSTINFRSIYYKNFLNKKKIVRKLFFFYLRKRKIKHSQHTNFEKFKNLFLKRGLKGKTQLIFFNILIYLKSILKEKLNKIRLIYLLKTVFKRLTFFCELKKKRKFKNELLIPYPVSKRRGFFLGMKLLIANSEARSENKLIEEKIAIELFETYLKKSNTHKDLVKYNKSIRKNLDNVKLQKLAVFHYID